jgi:hypothetical protein
VASPAYRNRAAHGHTRQNKAGAGGAAERHSQDRTGESRVTMPLASLYSTGRKFGPLAAIKRGGGYSPQKKNETKRNVFFKWPALAGRTRKPRHEPGPEIKRFQIAQHYEKAIRSIAMRNYTITRCKHSNDLGKNAALCRKIPVLFRVAMRNMAL